MHSPHWRASSYFSPFRLFHYADECFPALRAPLHSASSLGKLVWNQVRLPLHLVKFWGVRNSDGAGRACCNSPFGVGFWLIQPFFFEPFWLDHPFCLGYDSQFGLVPIRVWTFGLSSFLPAWPRLVGHCRF